MKMGGLFHNLLKKDSQVKKKSFTSLKNVNLFFFSDKKNPEIILVFFVKNVKDPGYEKNKKKEGFRASVMEII